MAQSTAKVNTVRMASRKIRLVADMIRGKRVVEARDILLYTPRASAPIIAKVLESAVANAENAAAETKERIDTDEMIVKDIQVNQGPTMRRYRPAPRGRATRIRKRSSHVQLVLSDEK